MKTNTVLIDLETYNDLRDFKEKMVKDHSYFIVDTYNGCRQKIVTIDEAVKDLISINNLLQKEINDVDEIASELNSVKQMSVWQFMKWRRK